MLIFGQLFRYNSQGIGRRMGMGYRPIGRETLNNIASIIRQAVADEAYDLWFANHAEERMTGDGLYRIDVVEVLRDCRIGRCRTTRKKEVRYVATGRTLDDLEVAVALEIRDPADP